MAGKIGGARMHGSAPAASQPALPEERLLPAGGQTQHPQQVDTRATPRPAPPHPAWRRPGRGRRRRRCPPAAVPPPRRARRAGWGQPPAAGAACPAGKSAMGRGDVVGVEGCRARLGREESETWLAGAEHAAPGRHLQARPQPRLTWIAAQPQWPVARPQPRLACTTSHPRMPVAHCHLQRDGTPQLTSVAAMPAHAPASRRRCKLRWPSCGTSD